MQGSFGVPTLGPREQPPAVGETGGSGTAATPGSGGERVEPPFVHLLPIVVGFARRWVEMEGEGVLDRMHSRFRMTIDPRIPTMPGQSKSGFHRPG